MFLKYSELPAGSLISVEQTGDTLILDVPSGGIWRGGRNFTYASICFAIFWMLLFTLPMYGLGLHYPTPIGCLGAVTSCVGMSLAARTVGRMHTRFVLSRRTLTVYQAAPRWKRSREWPIQAIADIELSWGQLHVIPVSRRGGATFGAMVWADREWICQTLRRAMNLSVG